MRVQPRYFYCPRSLLVPVWFRLRRLRTDGIELHKLTSRQERLCDPPGPFDLSARLAARLLKPGGITVQGDLDIDSPDGSPSNQNKKFVIRTGERVELRFCRLDSSTISSS
jgi:hypothetical protein